MAVEQGKARDSAESEKNAGEWKEEGQGLVRAPQDVLDVVLRQWQIGANGSS